MSLGARASRPHKTWQGRGDWLHRVGRFTCRLALEQRLDKYAGGTPALPGGNPWLARCRSLSRALFCRSILPPSHARLRILQKAHPLDRYFSPLLEIFSPFPTLGGSLSIHLQPLSGPSPFFVALRGYLFAFSWESFLPLAILGRPLSSLLQPLCALSWISFCPSVESRTGALTIGSGGVSVAFASGLSPAPLSRFQSPLSEPDVRFSRISALQWDHASRTQVPARIRGRLLRDWHPPLLHPLPLPGCRQAC